LDRIVATSSNGVFIVCVHRCLHPATMLPSSTHARTAARRSQF